MTQVFNPLGGDEVARNPWRDSQHCHSALGVVRQFYVKFDTATVDKDDPQPKRMSRSCLYAAALTMPTPEGMLFDPFEGPFWSAEQCRAARHSLWNVVQMVRAKWSVAEMLKWMHTGRPEDTGAGAGARVDLADPL